MWLGMLVTVPTGNPEFAAVLKVVRAGACGSGTAASTAGRDAL